jgi:hypothetical protein
MKHNSMSLKSSGVANKKSAIGNRQSEGLIAFALNGSYDAFLVAQTIKLTFSEV